LRLEGGKKTQLPKIGEKIELVEIVCIYTLIGLPIYPFGLKHCTNLPLAKLKILNFSSCSNIKIGIKHCMDIHQLMKLMKNHVKPIRGLNENNEDGNMACVPYV